MYTILSKHGINGVSCKEKVIGNEDHNEVDSYSQFYKLLWTSYKNILFPKTFNPVLLVQTIYEKVFWEFNIKD